MGSACKRNAEDEPIGEDAGNQGVLLIDSRLALDDRRDGDERVQIPAPRRRRCTHIGGDNIIEASQHGTDQIARRGRFVDLIRVGKQVALERDARRNDAQERKLGGKHADFVARDSQEFPARDMGLLVKPVRHLLDAKALGKRHCLLRHLLGLQHGEDFVQRHVLPQQVDALPQAAVQAAAIDQQAEEQVASDQPVTLQRAPDVARRGPRGNREEDGLRRHGRGGIGKPAHHVEAQERHRANR